MSRCVTMPRCLLSSPATPTWTGGMLYVLHHSETWNAARFSMGSWWCQSAEDHLANPHISMCKPFVLHGGAAHGITLSGRVRKVSESSATLCAEPSAALDAKYFEIVSAVPPSVSCSPMISICDGTRMPERR